MINVVVSGYYGFGNIGDEAILDNIIKIIKKHNTNINITVFTSSFKYTKEKYNVDVVSRNKINGLIKAIKKCDVFIIGGGSIFQDVTSSRSFIFYLAQLITAIFLRKKVYIYSQGIGPITKKFNKLAFKYFIKKADFISARDLDSFNELKNMGVSTKKMYLTADPIFLEREFAKSIVVPKTENKDTIKIGVSLRQWNENQEMSEYFCKLLDAVAIKLNAEIIFIPFYPKNDYDFSKDIMDKLNCKTSIINNDNLDFAQLIHLIKSVDFIIGMRLHSLIFSAISEIPFCGISYDPKIDSFLKIFNKEPIVNANKLDVYNMENVISHIDRELNDLSFIKKLDDLEGMAKKNANDLIEFIQKK